MKVLRIIVACILLLSVGMVSATANTQRTVAQNCQTLICVRNNIDTIDQQIVILIGQRLSFVKRAGEIKGNKIPVHDQAREDRILASVRARAEKAGYPGSIAVAIYKTILAQANSYENQR